MSTRISERTNESPLGGEKEGVEEKDDEDVEGGENPGQEEIDRPAADEGADVQKVIFQDAEGEKNGGDEAEISQRIDGNAADRKDREGKQEAGKSQPAEDILDPVSPRDCRRSAAWRDREAPDSRGP